MEYKDLKDYPCRFNPRDVGLGRVFDDDIARAVWMAYRGSHKCSDAMMISLKDGSLEISTLIRRNPSIISKSDLDLGRWIGNILCVRSRLGKELFLGNEKDMISFARFIRPYLKREKIATWKIVGPDYIDEL